jgi:cytochrome d ubiquinol oxidase subunit I
MLGMQDISDPQISWAQGRAEAYRLLRAGPIGNLVLPPKVATPNRPMSVLDQATLPDSASLASGE